MTDRELMQQALDALEKLNKDGWILADFEDEVYASIEALRARLAQPDLITHADVEQLARIEKLVEDVDPYTAPPQREWQGAQPEPKPLAWLEPEWGEQICLEVGFEHTITIDHPKDLCWIPLYTAPPQREWQTLTENEIKHLWYEACQTNLELTSQLIVHLARNIEAKLKEKNT